MRTSMRLLVTGMSTVLTLLLLGGGVGRLGAKDKSPQVSSDDPTFRLYSLLDSKYNGKLDDFYLLADVANDPKNPGQPQQHVLRVEYSKDRAFGKLRIYVRTVGQVTPEQLKAYTPKQIYEFAENDSAKFTKTDPGSFGKVGDVYFEPVADGALGTTAISSEVQTQYERFVTQYLIPALEKKTAEGSGT
ncbi:MAG: hypothetical protein ACLQVL_26500 [Terriglobia bacterium]